VQNKLTTDGCHMNAEGNKMMARGVLRAFGMTDAQLAEAEKSWSQVRNLFFAASYAQGETRFALLCHTWVSWSQMYVSQEV